MGIRGYPLTADGHLMDIPWTFREHVMYISPFFAICMQQMFWARCHLATITKSRIVGSPIYATIFCKVGAP